MVSHAGDRFRHLATRTTDARIVKQNHFVFVGQRIRDRWVPIVERAREVLKKEQRRRLPGSKSAVSIGLAVRFE